MSKIGLALGGGAARGMAHIGVLQALAELGIEVSHVAGTSSGSIIGALFAAGYAPADLADLARNTSWRDLGQLLIPRFGLLGNERLERLLQELLRDKRFDQLAIPFAAVCTDLYTAGKVVLREGNVARAVRASCSIPGVFAPFKFQEWMLVDGGLVENVPVKTVREMGTELVIGVDLYAYSSQNPQVEGIIGVLTRAFEIMQRQLSQSEFHTANVMIAPKMDGESLIDLGQADRYMEQGYQAAMARRDALLDLISK